MCERRMSHRRQLDADSFQDFIGFDGIILNNIIHVFQRLLANTISHVFGVTLLTKLFIFFSVSLLTSVIIWIC